MTRPIVTCQPRLQTKALNAYLDARAAGLPFKLVLIGGSTVHYPMYGFTRKLIFVDGGSYVSAISRDRIDSIHTPTIVWKSRLGDVGEWKRELARNPHVHANA